MALTDPRGLRLSGVEPRALDRYERALDAMLSFHGDPIGGADEALALDPSLVSAHLLKAHTFAFSLHPSLLPRASASLDAARALAADDRERGHIAAAGAWLRGDPAAARAAFDTILDEHPRDLLALMFAHQADFFGAAGSALLDRPSRALEAWSPDLPGHGYVLGMRAFGLEEAGHYAEAESLALEALAANPKDAWAIHAVAHVMEMQGRAADGAAWYAARRADWAEDCFFAVHNWWHWALCHVDRDEPAEVLALYDAGLAPSRRSIALNLCDAAALLWRLWLAGHETGERFSVLADLFDAPARSPVHIFVDIHAMLAFVGAGRTERATAHLAGLEARAAGEGPEADTMRAIGLPACRALFAMAEGDWRAAHAGLAAAMPHEHLMTGSHAQRDVLAMTLIETAIRAGEKAAARRLLRERLARKPASRRIAHDLARCG